MAPAGGALKGAYRQRKKCAGVANKPSPDKKRSKNAKPQQCTAQGAADSGGYGVAEEELRRFDLDMAYGPCIGVTRLRRWERAAAMGLRPPPHLRDLILRRCHDDGYSSSPARNGSNGGSCGGNTTSSISLECLWAGKV